jgi:hypothetical protein
MSKRDTDTRLWEEDWFLSLPGADQLWWFWIKDHCDHAGIYRPNVRLYKAVTGFEITSEFMSAVNSDKERIRILPNGKWWIVGFCLFHYPSLNTKNRFHKSVIDTLLKNGIDPGSTGCKIDGDSVVSIARVISESLSRPSRPKEKEKEEVESALPGFPEEYQSRPEWKDNYNVYLKECEEAFDKWHDDWVWIEERKVFMPKGMSIQKTLEKAFLSFWGTEAGWHHCKKKKTKKINWARTILNCLDMPKNRVYYGRNEPDLESKELERRRENAHASTSEEVHE